MPTEIKHPLPELSSAEAEEMILTDLFRSAYRGDGSEWDKQLASAYERVFGDEFAVAPPGSEASFPALALYGPPGHGKTSSFISAGQRFCKEMDLNFVFRPDKDYVKTDRDFVFVSMEMAGEASNVTLGGIPSKESFTTDDGKTHSVMDKLVDRKFLHLKGAAAGILIFDDFNNAAPVVQNQLLPIAQFRKFQGIDFGRCLVALTGNLGSADNTSVYKVSLALKNRCKQYYFEDNAKDFVNRADKYWSTGSAGFIRAKDIVTSFISTHEEMFAVSPSDERISEGDTYASSRSWTALVGELGQVIGRLEKLGSAAAAKAQKVASANVGSRVASEFGSFFYQMATEALPLAREIIVNGKLDGGKADLLKEKLGNKINAQEQDFSQQFAFALANNTAERLIDAMRNLKGQKKQDALHELGKNYFVGLNQIEAAHQNLSLTRMRSRFENVLGDVLGTEANTKANEAFYHMATGFEASAKALGVSGDDYKRFKSNVSNTLAKRDALSADKLSM
jgi:DNA polymerase III delta prime subunit